MGKRSRRNRKFRKYLAGKVNVEVTLSGLGQKAVNTADMPSTVVEKAYCTSVDAAWSMQDFTPGVGRGPIMVGLGHTDYTNAEIEEYIENVGSWDEGNLIQQEVSKRKIRIVGIFPTPVDATHTVVLNDGKLIHTKMGIMLQTGQTLEVFAYNLGTASMATTTPRVTARGTAHLWPA